MPRLLTFLLMIALAFTNGPAVASAICEHGSARAHVEALHGSDSRTSASAHAEDAAAKAAAKAGLADSASAMLAGYMMPPDQIAVPLPLALAGLKLGREPEGRAGRSLRPLLEPPLA